MQSTHLKPNKTLSCDKQDELFLNHNNLAELIEQKMHENATKPAYQCIGQTLTFAEIDKMSAALSSYLLEIAQLNTGDRVIIQLPNLS